jgi:hypothetical protein
MDWAGIYVITDLSHECEGEKCAITGDQAPDCYPVELKTQGQAVINAFAKYNNTLAFSAGNEVNHYAPPSFPEYNAPCQKQFIRDMRAYMNSCSNLRHVPIGLVSADDERDELSLYYNCQTNPDDEFEAAEWYGLNSYVFCNGKARKYEDAPGFQLLQQSFAEKNYSIPVLLTEFGCISESFPTVRGVASQRNFLQAKWLLEEEPLRDSFSGGFAFEYSIEKANAGIPYPFTIFGHQNFGVGYFGPDYCDDIHIPCIYHPHPSFDFLKEAYTTSNISVSTTRDNFEVSTYRQGRSKCPKRFPAPGLFTWETDKVSDLKCPTRGEASNFACPANPKHQENPGSRRSKASMFFVPTGSIVIAILFTVIIIQQYRKSEREKSQFFTIPSNESDGEGYISSDESACLLPMQTYQAGGGPDYQAIQSDSSSEDLDSEARR